MDTRQPIVLSTCLLVATRLGLFATCRRFIDRSLYDELKQISQISPTNTPVELDTLPQPTATQTRAQSSNSFNSVLSKTLFSLCFSESCTLFLLLMCQALDVFNTRTRLLNFQISLYTLLLNIIMLIPVSLCVVSTTPLNSTSLISRRRILAVLAPLSVYFLLLSYVPLPGVLLSEEHRTITLVMARYNVLGTVILGSLSGFGSVTTAWGYFPLSCGKNRKTPTPAEVDRVEQSLLRVRADLASKREELTSLKRQEASQTEGTAQKSSWLSRVAPNFRGDNELSNAQAELSALISLEENMASELRDLQRRYAEATFDRTWQGRLYVLMRHATGFYCIFRSLVSLSNIFLPASHPTTPSDLPNPAPDLFASTLLLLIPHPSPLTETNITYATRQANLVLVGAVIIGSIRRVLQGAARALRATPASRNRVASLVLLVLAQLMGIYLLSTLVQLRTSFPPADTGIFSALPAYETFGSVFDWSFLVSAGLGLVVEWMRGRAQEL